LSKTFPDIAAADIDAESPLTEALVGSFYDRDESLISNNWDTRFAEGSTASGSFAAIATVKGWLPESVGTGGGDVTLVVVLEAIVDGTATGRVQARLGGSGTWQESGDVTATSYGTFITLTIPAADVDANAGLEVDLEIEARVSAGAGNVMVRCLDNASRLERAA